MENIMKRFRNSRTKDGVTRMADQYVNKHIDKIGQVEYVRVYKARVKGDRFPRIRTTIKGTNGTIRVGGYHYGYYGTGPQGLHALLNRVGINVTMDDIAGIDVNSESMPSGRTSVTIKKFTV
jgi:hypothetical protein